MSFPHKQALLALLQAHPERALPALQGVIHGLPQDLEYADISSAELAHELLLALTKEVQP